MAEDSCVSVLHVTKSEFLWRAQPAGESEGQQLGPAPRHSGSGAEGGQRHPIPALPTPPISRILLHSLDANVSCR